MLFVKKGLVLELKNICTFSTFSRSLILGIIGCHGGYPFRRECDYSIRITNITIYSIQLSIKEQSLSRYSAWCMRLSLERAVQFKWTGRDSQPFSVTGSDKAGNILEKRSQGTINKNRRRPLESADNARYIWCRRTDSNRHGVAPAGFWVPCVYQFHHAGEKISWFC